MNDRRHGSVSHLALALSVRDFIAQVKAKSSDPDLLVPSEEWVRLQFWPKTPSSKAAMHYTGRLKVKFKIQQRQWRRDHVDCHYAAACFRYMREYAIMVREYCMFICLDDKHKVKIGEPDCPVASAERGRRVPMEISQSFQAGDHDFTKFGVIPSVAFVLDIPDDIQGSWYTGDVYVGLKILSLNHLLHNATLVNCTTHSCHYMQVKGKVFSSYIQTAALTTDLLTFPYKLAFSAYF